MNASSGSSSEYFPRLILIAISQQVAGLISTSFSGSAIAAQAS